MEVWKDIKGFEGFYQVSNLGNVKSLDRKSKNQYADYILKGKVLKAWKHHSGYMCVKLCDNYEKKTFLVHRLVALNFLDNEKEYVNHIDFDKTNNKLSNLEFCTPTENVIHYENSQKRYSKYLGVTYDKNRKKWLAKFKRNGRFIFLGRFDTEIEAYKSTLKYV
jgi:hypothetical protein